MFESWNIMSIEITQVYLHTLYSLSNILSKILASTKLVGYSRVVK